MLNLDDTTLRAVAEKAAQDAAGHPRWLNAIGRALVELAENPYLERANHGLLIGSPSGNCYAANGVCQCEAWQHGKRACWHRAAARLVRLHDEMQSRVCEQPDNLCDLHAPCATHAQQAADYLKINRKIAAARRALELVNELF